MKQLIIRAKREEYAPEGCTTITVGELIDLLSHYSRKLPIYLSHNGGYTYGGIIEDDIYISINEACKE